MLLVCSASWTASADTSPLFRKSPRRRDTTPSGPPPPESGVPGGVDGRRSRTTRPAGATDRDPTAGDDDRGRIEEPHHKGQRVDHQRAQKVQQRHPGLRGMSAVNCGGDGASNTVAVGVTSNGVVAVVAASSGSSPGERRGRDGIGRVRSVVPLPRLASCSGFAGDSAVAGRDLRLGVDGQRGAVAGSAFWHAYGVGFSRLSFVTGARHRVIRNGRRLLRSGQRRLLRGRFGSRRDLKRGISE